MPITMSQEFIVFKGDDIVAATNTLEEAEEVFDSLPPRQKAMDGRAIYQLVKED